MISLVFRGYDNNNSNKQVIIKMKRKNIQQKLDEAIDNLLFSMYILSFIPIINKYQLTEVVNKNVEIIRHQTRFVFTLFFRFCYGWNLTISFTFFVNHKIFASRCVKQS